MAAFFAHSPNAVRLVGERLQEDNSSVKNLRGPNARSTSKAANETESAEHSGDDFENAGIGGNGDNNSSDPATENEQITRAVAAVPDSELRQALERSLREDSPPEYRELLQRRWAEINPSAAAMWATSLSDAASAVPLVTQTAIVWANRDMSAAVQWADSLPQGELRNAAVMALGYEGARSLSFEAFDLVAGLEPSIERDALLEHIVRQWSASDANQALTWVQQVPDSALRQKLIAAVAATAAQNDPAAAAGVVASELSSGPTQNRAAVEVAQRWAQTDSESAAAWVDEFPQSEVKSAAEAALGLSNLQ